MTEERSIRRPSTRANAWMIQRDGDALRYMSDQHAGSVMGFEEREGITLAQTPDVAIGMIAFGAGVSVERDVPQRFPWHVVNSSLDGNTPNFGAQCHGVLAQMYRARDGLAYQTVVAISASQPGITEAEAQVGGDLYGDTLAQVRAAKVALGGWDKKLFVDRIRLCLLAGASHMDQASADFHYAAIGQALRHDVAATSGQASFPALIVSQSAGSQTDGTSDVILAEGLLNIEHPTLGFIVATPSYPFAMMPDMPTTHSTSGQALIDEMETLALRAVHAGMSWRCPMLRLAWRHGKVITADFATLSDLVLEEGAHGFHLEGAHNTVKITKVLVHGNRVTLHLNKEPTGTGMALCYAWGQTKMKLDGTSANKGALRDNWEAQSLLEPGRVLHRFALSAKVALSDPPLGSEPATESTP